MASGHGAAASERTPLLVEDGRQEDSSYRATISNGTDADRTLDDAERTKLAQDEAERIKAQLPRSLVVPSVLSLMSCLFIAAIDGTLVIALMGAVTSSFGASDRIFWLNTSYMLAMCAFSPIYGRTCDIVGRKACLMCAVLMFALGTAMCALAPSMTMLIVARAVQGVGAGGIQPCVGVVLNDLIPLSKRGVVHSIGQVVFSCGNALGGPLGGLLVDRFGWRFAFTIQVPPITLALTLLSLCLRLPDLPKTPKEIDEIHAYQGKPVLTRIRQRLDISGAVLLVTAVTTLLLAFTLVTVSDVGWLSARVIGLLVAALVATISFLYIEANYAREPLVPMRLLKKRTLSATWLILFTYCFAASMMYYFPFYFQTILEQTAAEVGTHLLPLTVSTTVGSFLAGLYMRKTGRFYWLMIFCAGISLFSPFWFATWDEKNRPLPISQNTIMVPMFAGTSAVFTILMVSPLAIVERHEQSQTIGLMYLFRSLGMILGVSSSGYLIQTILQSELAKRITGPGAAKRIDQIRRNIDIVHSLPPAEKLATKQSYAIALRVFHICVGILMIVCFFLCFFVEERNLNTPSDKGANGGANTTDIDVEDDTEQRARRS